MTTHRIRPDDPVDGTKVLRLPGDVTKDRERPSSLRFAVRNADKLCYLTLMVILMHLLGLIPTMDVPALVSRTFAAEPERK